MTIHVAFDFDSTITAAPDLFEPMMAALYNAGHHVTILTGNPDIAKYADRFDLSNYNLVSVDHNNTPPEKAAWCADHAVDLIIDNNHANIKACSQVTNAAHFIAKKDGPDETAIRSAFIHGYMQYGESELLDSTILAYKVLKETIALHHSLDAVSFAEAEGSLQGIYNQIFLRRDRLWQKYDQRAIKLSKRLSLHVSPADIVDLIRSTGTDELTDQASYQKTKDAIAVVLLYAIHSDGALVSDALQLVASAMREGAAEGLATSHVLMMHKKGKSVDFARTKEAAHQSVNDVEFDHHANDGLHMMLSGLAGDLVRPLRHEIADGSSQDNLHQTVTDIVAAGVGFSFYLDNLIQYAYGISQQEFYRRQAQAHVDFVTMGDQKVCSDCMADEAGNPYLLADVPVPPIHGGCRCFLSPV